MDWLKQFRSPIPCGMEVQCDNCGKRYIVMLKLPITLLSQQYNVACAIRTCPCCGKPITVEGNGKDWRLIL